MNILSLLRPQLPFGSMGWVLLSFLALMPQSGGAPEPVTAPAPSSAVAEAPKGGAAEVDVRSALRGGDVAAADRILDELAAAECASGANQLHAERRAVEVLAGIAFSSYGGEDHAVAVRAATSIIARAGRVKLDQAADRAAVAECAGEMAERITGDRDVARRWYATALQDNPSLENARRGLARLDALEAAQSERSREIEAAHKRAAELAPLPQPTPPTPISAGK